MEITTIIVTVLILLALSQLPRIVKRVRFVRQVNKLPGPLSYPIVGSALPLLLAPRNKQLSVLLDLLQEHQPIARFWAGPMAIIFLTRPEVFEKFINSTEYLEKSYVYRFFEPSLGKGLLTSTGEKWQTHRKLITPTFHFKILESFVEVFCEKSKILISILGNEVGSKSFDIFPYVTRCALDIICETAMGTRFNFQEGENATYYTAVHDLTELSMWRIITFWQHFDPIYRLTSAGKRHAECLNIVHNFTNKVIQERKLMRLESKQTSHRELESDDIGKKKRVAFLDMILESAENGAMLTAVEIKEEVDTFMIAGYDTVSSAVIWALYLLGLHPEVQDKAYDELEGIFEASDRPPTMKDLNEMKYLERVIKESLRLYSTVPFFGRHVKEDTVIGGYKVPAGCTVVVNVYLNNRNPDQFPHPENFDPDNFLPERVVKRHPYSFIPFSAGPRNCIGQKFAMLEMKTMLSYILRHYRLSSIDRREDINILIEIIMRPENGIRMNITPRAI